ncbi:hypothetical protein RM780_21535 [Streptomyces sp. DSM 44917]|uniref:DUF4267 domain-containing protein n=1 Tax=Streptomyces boetiae TaxID=3075541 RepID=A0ABU2LD63_9ACTN|nr:hypothetical protein [Streptomyces sp. DSM 44917]MDT0309519.1 hypothetical protein [Streptomyces sp. DSM 44917]
MRTRLLRTVGAATALYGLAVAARPGLLARPSGLGDGAAVRAAVRPLAWRDAASGLALALAPQGPALRTAAAVRLASDLGDAALLGGTLPAGRARRAGAVAVSAAWAALSVAGLLLPETDRTEAGTRVLRRDGRSPGHA